MNSGQNSNNYILNLHHNSPNLTEFYNVLLNHRVASDKYLLALYDEAFFSYYHAGESRGHYYGTITTNCYSFDGREFKFLITYPELDRSSFETDGAKFAIGKVTLRTNEKLLLHPTSNGNGNELLLYNTESKQLLNVNCTISKGLPNDFSSHEIEECRRSTYSNRSILVPHDDIFGIVNRNFDRSNNTYYSLNNLNQDIELKAINVSSGVESTNQSGFLNSKETTLIQETRSRGQLDYYLWHGNPFTGDTKHRAKIPSDAKISLYRQDGKIIYEFIDSQGSVIQAGKNFCTNSQTPDCKMENLNLIPNARTYLKSTLVSADIGDIANTPTINEANIIAGLVDKVAGKLVTDKANELGEIIFNKPITQIQGKTLANYVKQEMPEEIARDQEMQSAIAEKLRNNPGRARGPEGPQGQAGSAGATAREVAETLVIDQTNLNTLAEAVIKKEVNNREEDRHFLKGVAHFFGELVKRNDVLKAIVKGDRGERGLKGDRGDQGPPGIPGAVGIRGEQGPRGKDADPVQVANQLIKGSSLNVLSTEIAKKSELQTKVADELRTNPGNAQGPPGLSGPAGPIGPRGEKGIRGDKGNQGPPGREGKQGEKGDDGLEGSAGKAGLDGRDADPSEIMHKLAHNSRFKRSLKGEDGSAGEKGEQGNPGQDGPQGPRGREGKQGKKGDDGLEGSAGNPGLTGLDGRDGRDADPAEVAEKLITDQADQLVKIVRQEVVDRVTTWGASKRLVDSLTYDDILRIVEGKANTGQHKLFEHLLNNAGLSDPNTAKTFIGNDIAGNSYLQNAVADALRNDPGNARGPRARDGKQGRKGDQGERGDDGPEGPRGERGDDGAAGLPGEQGPAGQDADPSEIMNRLACNSRLKRSLKIDDSLSEQALDSRLNRSVEFNKNPQLKIVPGESYDENKKEANIELEIEGKNVVIATFLEIGYFVKDDNLYIRNHITGKNTLIPKSFHFLKVVEDGLDDYKLAFCNNLGNLFFDHKKYDPEYAGLPEEHRLIDLKYMKNAVNIDLSKYYYHTHTPLFAVKQGEFEGQSIEDYRADVYEIAKGKKIGTLIDEFGFFEHDQFYHIDHHQGSDQHSEELDVRIHNHEGNLQIGDNILHPIILDDSNLDLLDYLGYQFN